MAARYPCLRLEGGLLATDLIDRIAEGSAPGQKISDFGLEGSRHLSDEIAASWTDARDFWRAFQHRLERLPEDDLATSVTRDQWMIPLLSLLGYELTYMARAAEVDGQTYSLSHRAGKDENTPPVHIVGYRQSLDRRPESGRPRLAPHSLLQEYINRTEHLWGLVANGNILRLLRNSQRMRRQAYIEFDIQQMMEGEKFADFALLYRLTHRTRLPRSVEDAPESLLEKYYRETVEHGGRVRDHLRDGVEKALQLFANGLLHHPRNRPLAEKAKSKELNPHSFYRQLLRLIYRLLFLMVAEERSLITDNAVYRDHYSISRLRRILESRSAYSDYDDLWLNLKTASQLFQDENLGKYLGVPPLNGDLFDLSQTSDLTNTYLSNNDFLSGLWHLSMYRENERTPWRRINYAALDVEELGSIYESLLDFQPVFLEKEGRLVFELAFGMERKSTGSYYTPPELVQELIKSALEPVIKDRLSKAESKERALLSIKAVDPAAGSGHFLLAAARRLGRELAKVRTGDDEPSPEALRIAIRDVITHCIYGVDKNPLAVDLCKVALWMEGHAKGKPLTFLDHRIRCGDSMIGMLDLKVLEQGIPDEAFDPVAGDDKQVARSLKKQNRAEREGQRSFLFQAEKEINSLLDAYQSLSELPDDTPEQIRRKAEAYQRIQSHGSKWWHDQTVCHLWTAAFFVDLTQENNKNNRIPTTETLRGYLETHAIDGRQIGNAWALAQKCRFFHWPLEFPEVFVSSKNGFDCVLGNPPWERVKLQEKEFFNQRDPEIASAPNAAARKRLIDRLPEINPALWNEFLIAKREAECESHFVRTSGRYPLCGRGDVNTYMLFAENNRQIISASGRAGFIVPTGIATDDSAKFFFQDLIKKGSLVSLNDFENRERTFFPEVYYRMRFCLITLSGTDWPAVESDFLFFALNINDLGDKNRHFKLTTSDFYLFNPNTLTCPIFRSKRDSEIVGSIYTDTPILIKEGSPEYNPWGLKFFQMFHMTNDAGLFRDNVYFQEGKCRLLGNVYSKGEEVFFPLYEGRMMDSFDHRFASAIQKVVKLQRSGESRELTPNEKQSPYSFAMPRFWVNERDVIRIVPEFKNIDWIIGCMSITSATNARTAIATILPKVGLGNSIIGIFSSQPPRLKTGLIASFGSFVFDYVCKQKVSGNNFNIFIIKQLPVLPPSAYNSEKILFIAPRVLELVYTAWDIKPFADDLWRDSDEGLRSAIRKQWEENRSETGGHQWRPPEWAEIAEDEIHLPPFKWDENRRAILRAELDAYYAKLYGLIRDELRYILDPKDVYGPDFPGETFRVLKEKEEREYGEYRTRRLVLEAWDKLGNR